MSVATLRGGGRPHLGVLLLAGLAATLLAAALSNTASAPPSATNESAARAAYGKLPLSFIPNRGQTDATVRYAAQAPGLGFFLTDDKAVLSLAKGKRGAALEMRFVGANPRAQIVPGHRGKGTVNYLTGAQHQTGLPTYGEVTYRELWPGIDMVFRGQGGKLKYEFRLAPGANPDRIRLAYAGADSLALGAAGDLLIGTSLGSLRDSRPVSYQRIDGKRVPVESSYAVEGTGYGFALGAHDTRRPLVIDPALIYSTYLGGNGWDYGSGIAVDASGNAYVSGLTDSVDFPTTPGAFATSQNSPSDAFVAKLNATGTALLYSTYLGGSESEYGNLGAVDASGNAYVGGYTRSSDFPTTAGAFDTTYNGSDDAFVAKLNPTGSALVYSTYLGGDGIDSGQVTVDSSGNAYVGGYTDSFVFPTTAGAFDTTRNGAYDVFVAKLNPTGTGLSYSTYLGGTESESFGGIAVDSSGNAYVGGGTSSSTFPTTAGAFDRTANGDADAFVAKLNPTGSALSYSTLLGGDSWEQGSGIAVDATGSAYVTGSTGSTADQPESVHFPTTPGAYDTTRNHPYVSDAFVAKLNADGTALSYSTYLGGASSDGGTDIAVDATGNAHVGGYTYSVGSAPFPTTAGAFDTTPNGNRDIFLTKLSANGAGLSYSTYFGGSTQDWPAGIAIDSTGSAYLTGYTGGGGFTSSTFPTTAEAFDATFNSNTDAFASKLLVRPVGYARPKAAASLHVTLVPAYAGCESPNRTHGPPLTADSCNPPARTSDELTLGTADSNGKPTKGAGLVSYAVLVGNPATPQDEANVRLTFELRDVYEHPALADYTGEVRLRSVLRITDKRNQASDNATVSDMALEATVPCIATSDATEGAACNLATTLDALVPGSVPEGKRSVWELGQVQVDDGGADGDADTPGDNTLFMVQGLFVP